MNKRCSVASVHGMCGGVFAALKLLEKTISLAKGEAVYVLHELVHNNPLTEKFTARGVHFADSPEEIPPDAWTIIGAHGVAAEVEKFLRSRTNKLFDATCPLVKKLQTFASELSENEQLVIYGKPHHPEVAGICGNSHAGKTFVISSPADIPALPELEKPYFISQTTVDAGKTDEILLALQQRYPHITCSPGVCSASRLRQQAVQELAKKCDLTIIVGSSHSSNACRLRETARNSSGKKSFLVDGPEMLPFDELAAAEHVGLSSGASTPEDIFESVLQALEKLGFRA